MIFGTHPNKDSVNRGQLKAFCRDICSYLGKKNLKVETKEENKTKQNSECYKTRNLTWANITAKHTWRRRVDFPPMLGPVRSKNLALPEPPMVMSLGTNAPLPKESLLRTGCPKLFAEKVGTSFEHVEPKITGRHVGPS